MIGIRETDLYARWFEELRDIQAKARILVRVRRLSLGNPGDVRPVGEGGYRSCASTTGPGYRVYFVSRGERIVVLLAGGDKASQTRDIDTARELARGL
jgi:putative addiction module killer protein